MLNRKFVTTGTALPSERRFNKNHGPDGKFTSGGGSSLVASKSNAPALLPKGPHPLKTAAHNAARFAARVGTTAAVIATAHALKTGAVTKEKLLVSAEHGIRKALALHLAKLAAKKGISLRDDTQIAGTATVEKRDANGNKRPMITGYAAVFNSPTEMLGKGKGAWREIVRPGAFKRSLASKPDVIAHYNHGDKTLFPLGRTSAGTLRLFEDHHGLRYEIDPPDTQEARDLMESIRRGDVRHSSFAFKVNGSAGESWSKGSEGTPTRELHDVDLVDVAPVTQPAYRDTTCRLVSYTSGAAPAGVRRLPTELDVEKMRLETMEIRYRQEREEAESDRRYSGFSSTCPSDLSAAKALLRDLADPMTYLSTAKAKLAELDGKRLSDFSTADAWQIYQRLALNQA